MNCDSVLLRLFSIFLRPTYLIFLKTCLAKVLVMLNTSGLKRPTSFKSEGCNEQC
jgi:hypothetical protein